MIRVVELDFERKTEREVSLEQLPGSRSVGRFCWIDLSGSDAESIRDVLTGYSVDNSEPVQHQLDRNIARVNDSDGWMHFEVADVELDSSGIEIQPVDIFLGDGFFATVHRHESGVIRGMRSSYSRNFRQVAKSPGFLHFELVDHLTQQYTAVLGKIAERTEDIESRLFEVTDDTIFGEVSLLMRAILEFSKTVMGAREVFHDLSTRLSPYIPQTTQPFLEKKAGQLDRMSVDITTEREVLSESLNLYMGIVTHRTNHLVTRLTVISALFLPLSFLVGVYGMNFEFMPELHLDYGYAGFWVVVVSIVGGMTYYMKRSGWL